MAFNGHQRDDGGIDEDETPTKQPRSDKEKPGYSLQGPNNEVSSSAEVSTSDRRTSNSTARHRRDSVKKTRPRRCYRYERGLGVFTGRVPLHDVENIKGVPHKSQSFIVEVLRKKECHCHHTSLK